jgi:hypothetical protein
VSVGASRAFPFPPWHHARNVTIGQET